jgi:hypothetical protein
MTLFAWPLHFIRDMLLFNSTIQRLSDGLMKDCHLKDLSSLSHATMVHLSFVKVDSLGIC